MKLTKLHMFLILLLGLVLASLGRNLTEGYDNANIEYSREQQGKGRNTQHYDPFKNDVIEQGAESMSKNQSGTKQGISKNQSGTKQGISKSQIPKGQEEMYVLKSENEGMSVDKCPKCPIPEREKECPPCKPCGRCPEPAFECKKVPNYNVSNVSNKLPVPMLNSFADFN